MKIMVIILMKIEKWKPLKIIKRINRFVVLVKEDSYIEKAYINNTGRLVEFMVTDRTAYCIPLSGARKTKYRLFAVKDSGMGALIDTRFQMEAFEKIIEQRIASWTRDCRIKQRNPRLGESVLDYLIECKEKEIYVEVKSAVLRSKDNYAMYPDCPTLRGRRHIRELIKHVRDGGEAWLVFIAGLPYVKGFRPYGKGDPEIPRLIRIAYEQGVLIKAINIYFDPESSGIVLGNPDLRVEI